MNIPNERRDDRQHAEAEEHEQHAQLADLEALRRLRRRQSRSRAARACSRVRGNSTTVGAFGRSLGGNRAGSLVIAHDRCVGPASLERELCQG